MRWVASSWRILVHTASNRFHPCRGHVKVRKPATLRSADTVGSYRRLLAHAGDAANLLGPLPNVDQRRIRGPAGRRLLLHPLPGRSHVRRTAHAGCAAGCTLPAGRAACPPHPKNDLTSRGIQLHVDMDGMDMCHMRLPLCANFSCGVGPICSSSAANCTAHGALLVGRVWHFLVMASRGQCAADRLGRGQPLPRPTGAVGCCTVLVISNNHAAHRSGG